MKKIYKRQAVLFDPKEFGVYGVEGNKLVCKVCSHHPKIAVKFQDIHIAVNHPDMMRCGAIE